MANPIRVGIIGLNASSGQAGRSHVPAIQNVPELVLQGVANRTLANSQEAAQKFSVPSVFNDVDALVSSPDIDLVVVSTPVPSHHELVMKAIAGGKHVMSEWPFGANLAEATEMRDAAAAKGVETGMGLQGRATPDLNQLRDLIANGYVGKVISASMLVTSGGGDSHPQRMAWWAKRENGANMLTIGAAHNLDSLRYVLGDFTEVAALVRTQFPNPKINETGETIERTSADNLLISGELEGGALASVHIQSVPVHQTGMLLEIHGTDGAIVARSPGGAQGGGLDIRGARRGEPAMEPITIDAEHAIPGLTASGGAANFVPLYRNVAAAINGGKPVTPNFNTAVELHQLLDALERSSATGQRVRL